MLQQQRNSIKCNQKKRTLRHILCGAVVFLLFAIGPPVTAQASEWDDAYTFAQTYGNQPQTNEGYIYWGTSGSLAPAEAWLSYRTIGFRISIRDTEYYLELVRGGSIAQELPYARNIDTVGNEYLLYRVKMTDVIALFSERYTDVGMLFDGSQDTDLIFDSILTIVYNGIEGQGYLVEEPLDGPAAGRVNHQGWTQNTREGMKWGYFAASNEKVLSDWYAYYGLGITIPAKQKVYGVDSGAISFTGTYGYRKYDTNSYYVRSGVPFSLSFTSKITGGPATKGIQVTENRFRYDNTFSGFITPLDNPVGSNDSSVSYTATSLAGSIAINNIKQSRSNNSVSLTTTANVTMNVNGKTSTLYSQGAINKDGTILSESAADESITLTCDGTAPDLYVNSGIFDNSTLTTDWTNQNIMYSITAKDSISGLNKIELLDVSPSVLQGVTLNKINLTANQDGVYPCKVYAVDNVGNENIKYITLRYDATQPDIMINSCLNEDIDEGGYTKATTVDVEFSDDLSGIQEAFIRKSDGTVVYQYEYGDEEQLNYMAVTFPTPNTGINTYTIETTDFAGNTRTQTVTIRIEKPLTITSEGHDWTNQDVTVTAKVNPSVNISNIELRDMDNNNVIKTWNATSADGSVSSVITSEGIHNLRFTARDFFGSIAIKDIVVKIDKTAPVIQNLKDDYPWTNTNVTLSPTATDALSGMKNIKITDTSNGFIMSTSVTNRTDLTLATEQERQYKVSATDIAGNEAVIYRTIRIDKTAPDIIGEITENTTETDGSTSYYAKDNAIDITAIDKISNGVSSGMDMFILKNDSGNSLVSMISTKNSGTLDPHTGTFNIATTLDATQSKTGFTLYVKDVAGNYYTKKIVTAGTLSKTIRRVMVLGED